MSKDITTIEWIVEQMLVCNYINKKQYDNCKTWLLQEAKEMEKQNIIDAWNSAYYGDSSHDGEEYYNKTFNE